MQIEFSDNNSAAILYIEDHPDNRMLVRRVLQADGFKVLEAGNAYEALQVIENQIPDLILMDINMPDMDGYSLTKRLKNDPQFKHVPIIALTAYVLKGDRERSLDAGCNGYIQKPIDIDILPDQVKSYLPGFGSC